MREELPPEVAPLAFLIGTWRGEGVGIYPTIETFRYEEEVRLWCPGRPFLAYAQRTWSPADGRALHAETGYWRPRPDAGVEAMIAQPTGVVEVGVGTSGDGTVELASSFVGLAPTAKEVTRVERSLRVEGDVLGYEVRMAAVGVPLQRHLTAELRRIGD